jgi:hypothetical protein
LVFTVLDKVILLNKTETAIENIAIKVCLKHTGYGQETCTDMVQRMAPIILKSMATSFLSKDYMCAEILSVCTTPVYKKENATDAANAIISTKPDFLKDNNYINQIYDKIRES